MKDRANRRGAEDAEVVDVEESLYQWQVREIEAALREAGAGDFATG